MLNKKTLFTGAKIKVISIKANTSGIFYDEDHPHLISGGITLFAPKKINEKCAIALIGDELTVIKLPRKQYGVNVCQVQTPTGIIGEVFWTELRSNCILL